MLMTNELHNMEVWFQLILFGIARGESPDLEETYSQSVSTMAYLGHGEKTNYSANPPGRNTNPPGRNSQSARAEY